MIDELVKYSHKLKVLYVEDNIYARRMTKMVFDDFFDDIVEANDGEDGFNKFQNNKFDLIITDINMPNLNGLDMIEKIREIDINIPILILSAHNEVDLLLRSINLGIDGYILKPIDIDQVILAFERIIKKYKVENKRC